MAELPRFQRQQYAFAAHIRDPDANPAPEKIEDRRMAIYRDLFFNNVSQLLSKTFPVIHRILGKDAWRKLIRDYYSTHQAHTPLFLEMPREFLAYLQEEREFRPDDPVFLRELAHYEWVELALSIDERDPASVPADPDGDLLDDAPVLSPLAWPLSYRFPVHRISPGFQPDAPGEEPTYLVVFRADDYRIGFLEMNPVSARLLQLVSESSGTKSGRQLLNQIAAEMQHPNSDAVVAGGRDLLNDLRTRGVILGTTPVS